MNTHGFTPERHTLRLSESELQVIRKALEMYRDSMPTDLDTVMDILAYNIIQLAGK